MKVLILGLPRTGTQSLADALVHLGYGPIYHMREVGKNKHQALWIEAIEAKFEGKGKPWGREDFEQMLAGFEGVADYPPAILDNGYSFDSFPDQRSLMWDARDCYPALTQGRRMLEVLIDHYHGPDRQEFLDKLGIQPDVEEESRPEVEEESRPELQKEPKPKLLSAARGVFRRVVQRVRF